MRLTTLAGPGMHRGIEYSDALAVAVAETATALKSHLATLGHSPGPLGRRLLHSPLSQHAADLTPDLWAETTALAKASRVDLEDVLLLTFLDEVWGLTGAPGAPGCSVLARVVPGRPGTPPVPPTTEIGQTMDLPRWTVGRARALRLSPEHAPSALVLAYAGSPGLCGANDAGLGVAVNALTDVPMSEDGLGVAFITRQLLTLSTLVEAEAFLTTVPHAAGQAYTVAASDGIATFEAGPGSVQRITPPGVPALAHTNHRLAPEAEGAHGSESSRRRLELLTRSLQQHEPFADALAGEVVVDGVKWRDSHLTFGAFRAIGDEGVVRFIDGDGIRAGRRDWSRFSFH